MSHLTFYQFYAVIFLLLLFIIHLILGFIAIYYRKRAYRTVISIFALAILNLVLIETSNSPAVSFYLILSFRIIISILMILSLIKKDFINLVIFLTIIISSLYFHYVTIYLSLLPAIYLWLKNKPDRIDIITENHAKEILEKLNEAILVFSKNKVLTVNPVMKSILGDINYKDINEISNKIFNNETILKNSFNKLKLKSYYNINNKFYKINSSKIQSGIILTATDITEKINLQLELQKNINELNQLTQKIIEYSSQTQEIGISRERNLLYLKIEEIIKNGLLKLKTSLEYIEDCPPDNYAGILTEARTLLNEIRLLVGSWRELKES